MRLDIDQVITFEFRDVDIHMKSSSCKGDYIEVCVMTEKSCFITKPCPCIPLIPKTMVYMGFHIFFIFDPENILCVLVRTAPLSMF